MTHKQKKENPQECCEFEEGGYKYLMHTYDENDKCTKCGKKMSHQKEDKDHVAEMLSGIQTPSFDKKAIEEGFDKQFPVVTKGHHHYRRERHLKDFLFSTLDRVAKEAYLRGKKETVIEHCAEPSCPECNLVAYRKGYEDGVLKLGETAKLNYEKGIDATIQEVEKYFEGLIHIPFPQATLERLKEKLTDLKHGSNN